MAYDAHVNFGYSLVAVAPSPATTGTSLTVTTGEGARYPAVPFNASVWPFGFMPLPTNAEVVRVTARTGDVLTIVRAQEGSTARAIVVGDQIVATITAKTLQDIETLTAPLASGQIPFPATQVPSANANTLDDYEEGTWTPIITADGGASGQTYSIQSGNYTKIGRLVAVGFNVALTAKGTLSGNIQLGGLPMFGGTPLSGVFDVGWVGLATAYIKIVCSMTGTTVYLRPISAAATDIFSGVMPASAITNTSQFLGTAIYAIT